MKESKNAVNNTDIRSLVIHGKTWFVAEDICREVGIRKITSTIRCLRNDQKMEQIVRINNIPQKIHLVNYSGMLELMIRSGKYKEASEYESAEEFFSALKNYSERENTQNEKAATEEMVIQDEEIIRENEKTETKSSQERVPLQEIVQSVKTILELHGLSNEKIAVHLNTLVERITGIRTFQDEEEEPEEIFLIPTQIGWNFRKSAQQINIILEENGLQKKDGDNRWILTEKGKQYGKIFVVGKYHSNGTVRQIKWKPQILKFLKNVLKDVINK